MTTRNSTKEHEIAAATAGIVTHVRSTCQSYVLQAELTGFLQSHRPNDWPAGCTTHVSFAFQSSTVQAERKAKLCVYGGALVFLSVYNKFNKILFECFVTVEAGSTCCFSFAIHVSADT
jgi:hypothetical protein